MKTHTTGGWWVGGRPAGRIDVCMHASVSCEGACVLVHGRLAIPNPPPTRADGWVGTGILWFARWILTSGRLVTVVESDGPHRQRSRSIPALFAFEPSLCSNLASLQPAVVGSCDPHPESATLARSYGIPRSAVPWLKCTCPVASVSIVGRGLCSRICVVPPICLSAAGLLVGV